MKSLLSTPRFWLLVFISLLVGYVAADSINLSVASTSVPVALGVLLGTFFTGAIWFLGLLVSGDRSNSEWRLSELVGTSIELIRKHLLLVLGCFSVATIVSLWPDIVRQVTPPIIAHLIPPTANLVFVYILTLVLSLNSIIEISNASFLLVRHEWQSARRRARNFTATHVGPDGTSDMKLKADNKRDGSNHRNHKQ